MPATLTLTARLDSGISVNEDDLARASRDELEAVALRADYPESLRDAALRAIARCHEAPRLEAIYSQRKLVDRVSPGRTPWQTIRTAAEAELVADLRAELAARPANPFDGMRADRAAERQARLEQTAAELGIELRHSHLHGDHFGVFVSDCPTCRSLRDRELQATVAELGIELPAR